MQSNVYIAFIGISIAVLVFPGPSILLILANSLQRGTVAGLYTVAGGIVAMLVQLAVALAGLTSLASTVDAGFDYVRWAGAVYLLYLGVQRWRGITQDVVVRSRAVRNYRSVVIEGFIVALTNPGTMFFFVAFFPQFLNRESAAGSQLLLMAATFMVLTIVVDSSYALLSARIGRRLHDPGRVNARNRVSGVLLVVAAVALALANF
jgi:homoserine/homoserine lactone efflux protein